MLLYEEFLKKLKTLPEKIMTDSKATYENIKVGNDKIEYYRGSREYHDGKHKPTIESISIKELYEIYQKVEVVHTKTVKTFITGKKYAPAAAFLKEIFYDKKGNRIL